MKTLEHYRFSEKEFYGFHFQGLAAKKKEDILILVPYMQPLK